MQSLDISLPEQRKVAGITWTIYSKQRGCYPYQCTTAPSLLCVCLAALPAASVQWHAKESFQAVYSCENGGDQDAVVRVNKMQQLATISRLAEAKVARHIGGTIKPPIEKLNNDDLPFSLGLGPLPRLYCASHVPN
jgi:hypothetical protein